MRTVLKAGIALPMTAHITGCFVTNGKCRRAPDFSGTFIPDIDSLTGSVEDVIVRPGSQLVFVAIVRQREPCTRHRNQEAKRGIGNHVGPGLGCSQTFIQQRHIFAAIFSKTTKAVEKLESGLRQWNVLTFAGARLASRGRRGGFSVLRSCDLLGERSAPAQQDCTSYGLKLCARLRRYQISAQKKDFPTDACCVRREP